MRSIKIILLILPILLFGENIKLQIENMDIKEFINFTAKVTKKSILVTENIPGKVSFYAYDKIKEKEDIFNLLTEVLKSKNYALIKNREGVYTVVKAHYAFKEAPGLKKDVFYTEIIKLKNIDAQKAYKSLSMLTSRFGKIIPSSTDNLLIVTDFKKNVELIKKIVLKLDKESKKELFVYNLKYGNSSYVYPKLQNITKEIDSGKKEGIKIIEDPNSNSIIIISKKKSAKKIMRYISLLDKPDETSTKKFSIIRLKNSEAKDMAKLIGDIFSKKIYKNKDIKPSISHDELSNSLIVYATKKDTQEIKALVEALDIEKYQVYVQAKILEISINKTEEIGAKYGLGAIDITSHGLYALSANLGYPKIIPFDLSALNIETPTFKKSIALGAAAALLEQEGAAQKISEPSLLCINNTESSIYVGKTESVITQSSVGDSTTDLTKNTYTRQDIGLRLKIKPRISQDNKVTLNIKAILEDVLPGSVIGLPITTKREVETSAIVKNGESIIIGGLVKNNSENSQSKVPLLGDMPVLGNLFKYNSKKSDKTSLVVILTPYIVEKSEDLNRLRTLLGEINKIENSFIKKLKNEK